MNLYLFSVFVFSVSQLHAQILPVTADVNTVVLDHFDNATAGEARGSSLSYVSSQSGLSNAVDFSSGGSYVMYAETVNLSNQGTIEMWIKPSFYNKGLVNINWYNSSSYPSSGHIFHLRLDEAGKISLGGWGNPVNAFTSNSAIPLNSWTHIAFSWGDSSKIYINGKVDLVSELLFRPAVYMPTNYIYLPYWGESCGCIDEFHVSSVQRTNAEIASRVVDHTVAPPVPKEVIYHQVIPACGGTSIGGNGSSTYTLGQMVFNSFVASAGTLSEGIQQPAEIYFTGFNPNQLSAEITVYPNPTDDYIILNVKQDVLQETLSYQLFDLNGRLFRNDKIKESETIIRIKDLPSSCYLLKIVNKNNQSKTYKIIKK